VTWATAKTPLDGLPFIDCAECGGRMRDMGTGPLCISCQLPGFSDSPEKARELLEDREKRAKAAR
jgi:hypothetical protein